MWGEIEVTDPSCKPAGAAARWSAWKPGRCRGVARRTYFARLLDTQTNNWDAECKRTRLSLNGKRYPRPARCINKGIGGMWGEIEVTDPSCKPRFGKLFNDGCTKKGTRTWSARLHNTVTNNWDAECRNSTARLKGQNIGRPTRCKNLGVAGEFGEWDVEDKACDPSTANSEVLNRDYVERWLAPYVHKSSSCTTKILKDWPPDGCSTPDFMQDKSTLFYKDFFRQACNVHDLCYRLPWTRSGKGFEGKLICDDVFAKAMVALCRDDKNPLICIGAASAFTTGVLFGGQAAYETGQTKSASFGECTSIRRR